jgi:hypothetical protein
MQLRTALVAVALSTVAATPVLARAPYGSPEREFYRSQRRLASSPAHARRQSSIRPRHGLSGWELELFPSSPRDLLGARWGRCLALEG